VEAFFLFCYCPTGESTDAELLFVVVVVVIMIAGLHNTTMKQERLGFSTHTDFTSTVVVSAVASSVPVVGCRFWDGVAPYSKSDSDNNILLSVVSWLLLVGSLSATFDRVLFGCLLLVGSISVIAPYNNYNYNYSFGRGFGLFNINITITATTIISNNNLIHHTINIHHDQLQLLLRQILLLLENWFKNMSCHLVWWMPLVKRHKWCGPPPKNEEGLIGRSDIRLQTAVGMPVAMDAAGNMCVVVMFSPNELSEAPKDTFGIPMLPAFAE